MLLEKYYPKSTKDLFNSASVGEVKKFLASWKKGKALLLHGPVGTGKSVSVKLIAKELGYELVESHADEERNVKNFLASSMERGVFSRKKILLLEDVETLSMRGISDLIKNSGHPVICTINDAYSLSHSVRSVFKTVKFDKISESEIIRFIENLCREEKISMRRKDIEQLAKTCNGDIRSLLIDMEGPDVLHDNHRDVEDNVFNTLRIIFKSMRIDNSRIAMRNSEKNMEDLFRWIENNITEEYTDIETISMAFNYLSKADVFRSRIIKRQSWSLEKYFADLSVYGTSLAKTKPSLRFASYKPPVYFASGGKALGKLASVLHVSKKQAVAYIPILQMLAKRNTKLFEELGMDDSEIESIIDN